MKSSNNKQGAFWSSNLGRLMLIFVPLIVGVALLYPTYRVSQLEEIKVSMLKNAKDATDSLEAEEKFDKKYGKDLESAKKNALKLGLDLRGGMYVTLEVDVLKLIEESAFSDAVDETFDYVISRTKRDLANDPEADVIALFQKNFDKIARPKGKTLLNYFYLGNQKDVSEESVIEKLHTNAEEAIDQAQEVIRQRIDQYGVAEPNIQKQGNNRIMLELPGVQNESGMRSLLSTTARMEFNLVRNNDTIVRAFKRIDEYLYNMAVKKGKIHGDLIESLEELPAPDETVDQIAAVDSTKKEDKNTKVATKVDTSKKDTTLAKKDTSKKDTADPYKGLSKDAASKKYQQEHPFTMLFATYFVPGENQQWQPVSYDIKQYPAGEYAFRIDKVNMDKVRRLLAIPAIKTMIPADYRIAFEAKPDARLLKQNGQAVHELFCLKKKPELTGEVITDAGATVDQSTGTPMVLMYMNNDGADQWGIITEKNLKKRIAIVLDDAVYSAPTVQTKITGGSSQITGMNDMDEANRLMIVLKAGALKAPVNIVEERIVGPSLGDDSINAGINASIIALLLVILYMIFYYAKGGLIADFAVMINVLIIISVLAALHATLTLPGIAGIILTIGMAVDANVLIYERIREELARGRSLRSAVDEGYKKALTAIIDSNITTAITAVVLLWLGTGPIKGFANTVLIGIISTMFTAIFVTRAYIEIALWRGATRFNFGQPKQITE